MTKPGEGDDFYRSYNPFLSPYWLVSGKTVGGLGLYAEQNCFDRMEALRLYAVGSSQVPLDTNPEAHTGPIIRGKHHISRLPQSRGGLAEIPWAFGPPKGMKIPTRVAPAKAGAQDGGFPLSRE